jgi:hypothetical protein
MILISHPLPPRLLLLFREEDEEQWKQLALEPVVEDQSEVSGCRVQRLVELQQEELQINGERWKNQVAVVEAGESTCSLKTINCCVYLTCYY